MRFERINRNTQTHTYIEIEHFNRLSIMLYFTSCFALLVAVSDGHQTEEKKNEAQNSRQIVFYFYLLYISLVVKFREKQIAFRLLAVTGACKSLELRDRGGSFLGYCLWQVAIKACCFCCCFCCLRWCQLLCKTSLNLYSLSPTLQRSSDVA